MKVTDKFAWDLERFGFWPPKRLLTNKDLKPILVNSIPKSGTHLIESLLCKNGPFYRPMAPTFNPRLHTEERLADAIKNLRSNQMLFSHFPYSKRLADVIQKSGVTFLFIIRDPRDIVVSNAHFIPTLEKHVHHNAIGDLPFKQRLDILIRGSNQHNVPSVFDKTNPFTPWLDEPGITVRFEYLSRSASDSERNNETLRLLKYVGVEKTNASLNREGSSTTFRKGVSGDWANSLSSEQVQLFETEELLRKLGYA